MEKLIKAIKLADTGKWEEAHRIVQNDGSRLSNWIHANLHRQEGDIGNAMYWYGRCGEEFTKISFEKEREQILQQINKRRQEK